MSNADVIKGLQSESELLLSKGGTTKERSDALLRVVAKAWEAGWDACQDSVLEAALLAQKAGPVH